MIPTPAMAQTGTIEAAVVDFRNLSKVPNEMFATMATDAVVVELLRSGKFGVTTADALQAKMEELGYKNRADRTPKVAMTPPMMVRLGEEVGADNVVTGEISDIKIDMDRKRAEVRMAVRMLHVASGEWENGAAATGVSNPRIGYSADKETDLIIEAINNAAREAVENMCRYIIPEATIIGTYGTNEVLLNKGTQEGIYVGMEMIVLRRGETGEDDLVGRIRVTRVSDSDSRGVVVQSTRGMKFEDRVRAVFTLPSDTSVTTEAARADKTKRIEKGGKLLLGLALLVGVATIFKGGNGREDVPDAMVMAGASPDITATYDDGGILVVWNTPKHLHHALIEEYHLWRDNASQVGKIGGDGNVGPVKATAQTSTPYLNTPVGSFDHGLVDDTLSIEFTYNYSTTENELGEHEVTMPGITRGKTHTYWLSCLYRRTNGEDATYWETDPILAGRATYVSRPVCERPGSAVPSQIVDLSNVTFEWRGSQGADTYVIEVSSDSWFSRDKTWVDVVYRPTAQDGTLYTQTYTNVLRNNSVSPAITVPELRDVPPGGTVYWRVGARNRIDSPGPFPAGGLHALASGPKNTRYIYSTPDEVFCFMTLDSEPPPPPGDGGSGGDDGGGDDLPPPPPTL